MTHITVYIKNMAGDLLPVQLLPGSSLEQLAQTLYHMDHSLYPSHRTHLYRSLGDEKDEKDEKEKSKKPVPLEDGEVVSVFVSDEYASTGFFEKDIPTQYYWRSEFKKGAPYTRFTIPIANKMLYLYVVAINTSLAIGDLILSGSPKERKLYFIASFASNMDTDTDTIYSGYRLYDIMKDIFHSSITSHQMKTLYNIIQSHYTERSKETGLVYTQSYDQRENVMCDCGAVIRRAGLPAHYDSPTHRTLMKMK
jgi:hypothetical protein